MADLHDRIDAESENISHLLNEFPSADSLKELTTLEKAGLASLIHNFYNGIENILKQMLQDRRLDIPSGPSWHRDLLETASSQGIISDKMTQELRSYLAFRHFFSHAYALELDTSRMEPLVRHARELFNRFLQEIKR